MLTVRQAAFRRMVEVGGERLAEVEVHTGQPHDPELLVYFRNGSAAFEMVRVVANDADTAIDWYDNNLHDAFVDVTGTLFSGPRHTAKRDRSSFAEEVLATDGIRQELNRRFSNGGT